MFDTTLYEVEILRMLGQARIRLQKEYPQLAVYSISIWTDPDAAVSAVSFDTVENSRAKVAELEAYERETHAKLVAAGDLEMAAHFAPRSGVRRNSNPADFALREFVTVEHRAFEPGWEADTEGRCWKELEPALLRVRALAAEEFGHLPLHPEAQIAVNSAQDWFDYPIELAKPAI